jgi:hypothetical protein
MDMSKDAWNDVGDRFTAWGRIVAERYHGQEPDEGDAAATADHGDDLGSTLEGAARGLADELNRAFTALGDTLRDDAAKDQLKVAVRSLGDAVTVTVAEATDEIRKRLKSEDGWSSGKPGTTGPETPPTDPPSPSTPPPPD